MMRNASWIRALSLVSTLAAGCAQRSAPLDAGASDTGEDARAASDVERASDAPSPDSRAGSDATLDAISDASPRDATTRDATLGPRRFWWDTQRIDPASATDAIWGDGHVHSNFSGDGTRSASDMMGRALALGADFVWITDHAQTPENGGGVSASEFDQCAAAARNASDARRFAGCGVEYRLGYTRANGTRVFEAWHQIVHDIDEDQFGELFNVQGYTNWSNYQADLARSHAIAVVTHPSGPTAWYDDDDSAFRDTDPSHHPDTELIELNGGDDDASNGNNQVDGINAYLRFLNDGWQLSPVWDSDMHQFYPGAEQAKGYGTWIDRADWTAGNFRNALRAAARRHSSFANHPGDERNYLRVLSLTASGAAEALAGSTLSPRETLRLRVRANVPGSTERWTFKLFTNRNRRFDDPLRVAGPGATSVVAGDQQWEPMLDTTGVHWVVVYASTITGAPGPETQYLVSAPLWLNDR